MTATDRPLLLTRDPDLLDDLRRLSVAAGVEPDVVTTAAAGRRLWSAAPVVVVGDDLAEEVVSASFARRADVGPRVHHPRGPVVLRPRLMDASVVVPAVARRAGPPADAGAVTVEAALGLLTLLAVAGALVWCLTLLMAQPAVGEAARAGARVAARGDDIASVRAEARRLVPDAEVEVRVDLDHVVVQVGRSVLPPGALARWGAVRLHADAVALVERPS